MNGNFRAVGRIVIPPGRPRKFSRGRNPRSPAIEKRKPPVEGVEVREEQKQRS
jgi:hypothetical protein